MTSEPEETPSTGPPDADEQRDVIGFLEAPETHAGETPHRIDTHLSHVFLTSSDVYKLKRATCLDFVNYSTPALRRAFCDKEIEVNQAWAGDLYRGVIPVRRSGDRLFLGGDTGDPIEWLVHMQRFSDADRMDRRLADGRVSASELIQFADDLARIHQEAPPQIDFGGASAFLELIEQISHGLANARPGAVQVEEILTWKNALKQRSRRLADRLDARRMAGRVRPCHGDLHLRNICFLNNRLIGFDALEFSDAMRNIDVVYDLAFPLMDLIHAGRSDAASLVLNRYLSQTGDYDGLNILDLCLSLRAGIRALAASISRDDETAQSYFACAKNCLTDRRSPSIIAIGGRSGSGKSTIAAALAPMLGAPPGAIILRSDVIRKMIAGVQPEVRLNASAYQADLSAAVYNRMRETAQAIIEAGFVCILDATFLDSAEREAVFALSQETGLPFVPLWLDAPSEILRTRLAARKNDASDADSAVLDKQLTQPDPKNWLKVDASGDIRSASKSAVNALRTSDFAFAPDLAEKF